MKALFLIFHGFSPSNGISKKIHYQVNALKECGVDTQICYLQEVDQQKRWMIDSKVLCELGSGIKSKILKRIEYSSIVNYAHKEKIDLIYIRSDHNANPFTCWMVWKIRKNGIKTILEIPTYPYDQEYTRICDKSALLIDKCFRQLLAKQLNGIVTFSNHNTIFGSPTIKISNGIDFSAIHLKQKNNDTNNELHLIGVAEIHYWHGFDRMVQGLANYFLTNPTYKVFFHIVGEFSGKQEKNSIIPIIQKYHLENYVILHSTKHGDELDMLFENADMGIGSLARHRSNISHIKTLKNREYAARGIPFIYSEVDDDFEDKPYIMKVPADESPIDIWKIIDFYKKQKLNPVEIRNTVYSLSWTEQMRKVINFTQS